MSNHVKRVLTKPVLVLASMATLAAGCTGKGPSNIHRDTKSPTVAANDELKIRYKWGGNDAEAKAFFFPEGEKDKDRNFIEKGKIRTKVSVFKLAKDWCVAIYTDFKRNKKHHDPAVDIACKTGEADGITIVADNDVVESIAKWNVCFRKVDGSEQHCNGNAWPGSNTKPNDGAFSERDMSYTKTGAKAMPGPGWNDATPWQLANQANYAITYVGRS